MGLYSPIWVICVYAVALATALVLISISRYCRLTSQSGDGRFGHIDGLRGYLALGVFICHAGSFRQWLETGVWKYTNSSFFDMPGVGSVALFFMITAFLFWGRAIRARGRIDPRSLLVSRIRRLAPLYLCGLAVLILLVGDASGWTLRSEISTVLIAIARWTLIGLGGRPEINGVGTILLYGQVWTLWYEWIFYLALPFLAILWRPAGSIALIIAIIIIARVWPAYGVILNFAVGIALAEIVAFRPELKWAKTPYCAALAVAALVLAGITGCYWTWTLSLCVAPVFACACYGNNIFGLLNNGPARLLGATSYSMYLSHFFALQVIGKYFPVLQTIPAHLYWLVISLLTAVLIVLNVVTFKFVEQPWMGLGRKKAHLSFKASLKNAGVPPPAYCAVSTKQSKPTRPGYFPASRA